MKPAILTQKNVCAFLGLIMALTILWSANAEAKVENINEVIPMELTISTESEIKESIPVLELDITDIKMLPTITFINKYGEVVAEFYGDKNELKKRFKDSFEKGEFLTAFGTHEFYLL